MVDWLIVKILASWIFIVSYDCAGLWRFVIVQILSPALDRFTVKMLAFWIEFKGEKMPDVIKVLMRSGEKAAGSWIVLGMWVIVLVFSLIWDRFLVKILEFTIEFKGAKNLDDLQVFIWAEEESQGLLILAKYIVHCWDILIDID